MFPLSIRQEPYGGARSRRAVGPLFLVGQLYLKQAKYLLKMFDKVSSTVAFSVQCHPLGFGNILL